MIQGWILAVERVTEIFGWGIAMLLMMILAAALMSFTTLGVAAIFKRKRRG